MKSKGLSVAFLVVMALMVSIAGPAMSQPKEGPPPAAQPEPERGKIYKAMVTFFQEQKINFTEVSGKPMIAFGIAGKNGKFRCAGRANEKLQLFLFYSNCPLIVPENRRLAMAEFLIRINDILNVGNFDMNFDNGEISYRTSIDVEGDRLTSPMIKNCVSVNINTMDRWLPGIMAVINGGGPKEALAQIRGKP
jgi:hypothetical protein